MLVNKMPFDEELVSFADWGATEKAKCIAELNPAGVLPVLKIGDKTYAEHVSIVRYLARKVCRFSVALACAVSQQPAAAVSIATHCWTMKRSAGNRMKHSVLLHGSCG